MIVFRGKVIVFSHTNDEVEKLAAEFYKVLSVTLISRQGLRYNPDERGECKYLPMQPFVNFVFY